MINTNHIKRAVANRQLSLESDSYHYNKLWANLTLSLTDERLDDFDCFAFAWSLLPLWAKLLFLSAIEPNHKDAFIGVSAITPIEDLNPRQRELLLKACHRLLAASVTLFADWHFVHDFYPPYAKARKETLAKEMQEKKWEVAVC